MAGGSVGELSSVCIPGVISRFVVSVLVGVLVCVGVSIEAKAVFVIQVPTLRYLVFYPAILTNFELTTDLPTRH